MKDALSRKHKGEIIMCMCIYVCRESGRRRVSHTVKISIDETLKETKCGKI